MRPSSQAPEEEGDGRTDDTRPGEPVTPTMHAPAGTPTREAGPQIPDSADHPPQTVRVPVVYPPPTACAPFHTPAPVGDRKLSRSVFTDTNADESGVGLRVGDTFLGFKLVEELGQGAFARVFLAHQQSLAGRPVALKVTLRPTREAERLARLQHTNVVPVYSVHNAPPVQVICMPYLGRRTIADVIRVFRVDHPSRDVGRRTSGTRAARTTDIVDSGSATKPAALPASTQRADFPAPGGPSFIGDPAAVLPILAQLAAGLAHAHERGILHLDLKPANVLLPDASEPMLLDFNLSFDTTTADRELVGGTVPYMATEQLLDLKTRGRGNVDARTDLYSLGVMAFEMLAGTVPFPASSKNLIDMDGLIAVRRKGPPSLRELNPAVTPAVEAIVHKLLAPEPQDRYQSAGELKTDIERHLNNLPLAIAREPSVRERVSKWRRRNPGVAGRLLAASVFGAALGLGVVMYQKQDAAATSDAVARARTTRAALDAVRLDLVVHGDAAARARGIARAEELLSSYGLPGQADWAKRTEIARLGEQDRAALGSDLGELLLLLAQAKWREGEPKGDPAREEAARAAFKLNRAALACIPTGTVPQLLDRQAKDLAFAVGEEVEPVADAERKPNGRDLFLDAAAAISEFKYSEALPLLDRLVAEQPTHASAQFCLAYCKESLGHHDSALERYSVAQSMMPKDARPAFHRGLIYSSRNKQQQAEAEYSAAIELEPDYMMAIKHRGFARLWQEKWKDAEADLTRALALGAAPIQIHTYRYQARQKLNDTTGAAADRAAADALAPQQEQDFIARGNARLKAKDYRAALEDFQAAARLNPRSITALNNQIHILVDKTGDPDAGLVVATRLTELYPKYAYGRMTRALILARLARRTDAIAEAEQALKLSKDPAFAFRAARVYALTSLVDKEDQARAIALLEQAVKERFDKIIEINTESDLDPIRANPRFQKLADAIASLYQ